MDSIVELRSKKRLIVLVPEGLAGNTDLTQKVYSMAVREHCDVLYLAFVYEEDNSLAVSRNMATMKALTSSDLVTAKSKITRTDNWLNTLKDFYQPEDIIVCHAEQIVRNGFLKTTPIHAVLSEIFKTPIQTISGLYHPWQMLSRKWLFGLLFWVGCMVILAAFSLLEIQIDRGIQGLTRTALIFIVLAFEFGVFWVWNHVPKI
jgi:hypothetical protein